MAKGPALRIVAGELGGRRIGSPHGEEMRPTAERTREAIFSMAGPLEGLAVADLFCGSGALGLEALSRGAAHATFVDRRAALAQENVELLGVGDRASVVEARLPRALEPGGPLAGSRFDLVLCDPPYRLAADLGPSLDKRLPGILAPGGLLIVESSAQSPLRLSLPIDRERTYGAAHVAVHRRPRG